MWDNNKTNLDSLERGDLDGIYRSGESIIWDIWSPQVCHTTLHVHSHSYIMSTNTHYLMCIHSYIMSTNTVTLPYMYIFIVTSCQLTQ